MTFLLSLPSVIVLAAAELCITDNHFQDGKTAYFGVDQAQAKFGLHLLCLC